MIKKKILYDFVLSNIQILFIKNITIILRKQWNQATTTEKTIPHKVPGELDQRSGCPPTHRPNHRPTHLGIPKSGTAGSAGHRNTTHHLPSFVASKTFTQNLTQPLGTSTSRKCRR